MIDRLTIQENLKQFSKYEYERLYVQSTAREEAYSSILDNLHAFFDGTINSGELYDKLNFDRMALAVCCLHRNEVMAGWGNEVMVYLSQTLQLLFLMMDSDSMELEQALDNLEKRAFQGKSFEALFQAEVLLLHFESKGQEQ